MRRPVRPRTWQMLRAQEDVRVYAELQSKQRAAYGDDEAAREAAGKAALLRAKESLSTGWRARLCYTQRVRLAAVSSRLRGVRQRVQAVGSARECARERATRERSWSQSSSVCVCGHSPSWGAIARVLGPTQWSSIGGCCSRPRTNAEIIWCKCSRPMGQRTFGVRMRVSRQRPRRGRGAVGGGWRVVRETVCLERGACRETAAGGMHL